MIPNMPMDYEVTWLEPRHGLWGWLGFRQKRTEAFEVEDGNEAQRITRTLIPTGGQFVEATLTSR